MAAPQGRKKNVSGTGSSIHTTGGGLGTGPVGNHSGSNQIRHDGKSGGGPRRAGGGKLSPIAILIAVVVLLGGGGGLSGLFGGAEPEPIQTTAGGSSQGGLLDQLISFNLAGSGSYSAAASGTGWSETDNTGKLDTTVAKGSRDKYTAVKGGGKDSVTLMIYMCGTDLESQYGMATKDLQEMAAATLSSKVNLLIYTGGCSKWKTPGISSSKNQTWRMNADGKLELLQEENASSMTKPANLSGFIRYCSSKYPADRNMLIFWDHGGGSVSGYGYDEKSGGGSMTLTGINQALKDVDVRFDFIGFDACLMATAETALMLGDYADYMIGSEESEPGIGWYYTTWLTKLSQNSSMSTLEIGRQIADDFVKYCASQCPGQSATLSVVDLAELCHTAPAELKGFAASTSELLQKAEYKTVSDARSSAREFAASSRIDQVDLVDLCYGLGTKEARELADAVLGAVKYNKTSKNMTNAYGLSIYFPYKKIGNVDNAVNTFEAVGMDDDYLRCIQEFAAYETGGQAISGGAASPLSALLSGYTGGGTTASSSDMIGSILSGLLSGSSYNVSGLDLASGFLTGALSGRSLQMEDMSEYLAENRFRPELLEWKKQADGRLAVALPQDQWDLVQQLQLNLFVDDGRGYIDLGFDNSFELSETGLLYADYDYSWFYIEGRPAAYYYISSLETAEGGTRITGYVPALLDGERVELDLVMEYSAAGRQEAAYISGFRRVYAAGETATVAKTAETLPAGASLEFIADYYSYEGEYLDTYRIGEAVTVGENGLKVEELYLPAGTAVSATYLFTDIYGQEYWTPVQP